MAVNAFATGLDHPRSRLCAAERRRAGGRNATRRRSRTTARASRAGSMKLVHGPRRRRHAERQPHHAAARRRWRRRRRDQERVSRGAEFAVRHGAGRRRFLCRQYRCDRELPLSGRRHQDHRARREAGRPARRHRSTITGPRISSPAPTARKLYATVGSNSNVGENGIEAETDRAAVLEVDRASGKWRVFASGLRNPNGLSWQPQSGALWVAVNERDELGNDLVPDYMTSVKDGGFYGWPYSYYGQHVDARVAAAAARSGGEGDRAGLRARRAHRVARPDLQHRRSVSARDGGRRLHRPARLVESQAARAATR